MDDNQRPFYAFSEAEKAHFQELETVFGEAQRRFADGFQSALALIHKQQNLQGVYVRAEDGSGLKPIEQTPNAIND
jgi:hypothetical protein